jgi:hypothetical protein
VNLRNRALSWRRTKGLRPGSPEGAEKRGLVDRPPGSVDEAEEGRATNGRVELGSEAGNLREVSTPSGIDRQSRWGLLHLSRNNSARHNV